MFHAQHTSVGVQMGACWGFDAVKELVDAVHFPEPFLPETSDLSLQLCPAAPQGRHEICVRSFIQMDCGMDFKYAINSIQCLPDFAVHPVCTHKQVVVHMHCIPGFICKDCLLTLHIHLLQLHPSSDMMHSKYLV